MYQEFQRKSWTKIGFLEKEEIGSDGAVVTETMALQTLALATTMRGKGQCAEDPMSFRSERQVATSDEHTKG